MRAFVRDQAEAVRLLREEKTEQERDTRAERRLDACHLALRFYDTVTSAEAPSPRRVIETARLFEAYLAEP